jgi:hypothetical protein
MTWMSPTTAPLPDPEIMSADLRLTDAVDAERDRRPPSTLVVSGSDPGR